MEQEGTARKQQQLVVFQEDLRLLTPALSPSPMAAPRARAKLISWGGDAVQRDHTGNGEQGNGEENCAAGDEITDKTHHDRGADVSGGIEALAASEAGVEEHCSDQPQGDGIHGRNEQSAGAAQEYLSGDHCGEDGPSASMREPATSAANPPITSSRLRRVRSTSAPAGT